MRKLEERYKDILEVCRVITADYYDLAHDVVLKLYDNQRVLDEPLNRFKGWVYVTAKNQNLNELKKIKPYELQEYNLTEEPELISIDPYEYIKRIQASDLGELERLWIELYLDEEGSCQDIADKLGISRVTVWSHIEKIKKKLI